MNPETENNQNVGVEQDVQTTQVVPQPIQQLVQPMVQQPSDQGVIAPSNPTTPVTVKSNKKKKTLLVILILALIVAGGYFITKKNKPSSFGQKNGEEELEKIKVDTGKKWGDAFASYFQEFNAELLYDEDEEIAERNASIERKYEIFFVDFDLDGTPEMVVRYYDNANLQVTKIMSYTNEEVSESKSFSNSSFKIVYSLESKEAKWYIYISNGTYGSKYGAYTMVDKILAGKAYTSDIRSYNDKDIADYIKKYVVTEYKYEFYKIDEQTFETDFKYAVSKFENSDKEIKTIREKLINDYANSEVPEDSINSDENITVGQYTLEFGRYVAKREVYENGEVSGAENVYVTINRDGTITDGTKRIKYNVYVGKISLENGINFDVVDNNKFVYGVGNGLEYSLVE